MFGIIVDENSLDINAKLGWVLKDNDDAGIAAWWFRSQVPNQNFIGLLHSVKGPALIDSSEKEMYFYYGKEYSREEWFEKLSLDEKREMLWTL